MQPMDEKTPETGTLQELCREFREHNGIPLEKYDLYNVKRGLRNPDGTGVMAGLTRICNVHGYLIDDGERIPDQGKLTYRGVDVRDLVEGCIKEHRFGYEETAWLLLSGRLPHARQLEDFSRLLNESRDLPPYFAEDMIIKAPSRNIMNKLARSVLALYSYDENPEEETLENNLRQSVGLLARLPLIMSYAYQVKRRHYDRESMYFHPTDPRHSTAEAILNAIRPDRQFTPEEARLLDLCMILHAEHGGGNNSTFTVRVLTSTGTDIYSAMAAAIGSLKGPLHGGANHQVMTMMEDLMENVRCWQDPEEIEAYLEKILRGKAGDGSGLLYGIGHAVYTLSDPRAVLLREEARSMAESRGMGDVFRLFEQVERLAPQVFAREKGDGRAVCANVDFYSGLVYRMLGIPEDLYTPLFAVSRVAGWCAHRIEELETGHRIIRPAYRSLSKNKPYVPLSQR